MQPETAVHASAPPGPRAPRFMRRVRTYIAAGTVLALIVLVTFVAHSCSSLERRRARNRTIVTETAIDMDISPALALAVAEVESNFDDRARSSKGAVGLMQVMPGTAKDTARGLRMKSWDLRNPRQNAKIGLTYLRELNRRYRGDVHLTLAAYNAGPMNVVRWCKRAGPRQPGRTVVKRCAFKSTRTYISRVLAAEARYNKDKSLKPRQR